MEKEKKPIYKKWWFWLVIIVLVVALLENKDTQQGIQDGLNSSIYNSTENAITNNVNATNISNDTIAIENLINTETNTTSTTETSTNSTVSQLKLESLNVYNGFKTEIIGKAYVIKADKQTIFNFSKEDWLDFRKLYLDTHQGDNWLTIYFEDKTGIIFTGMGYLGTLCDIDPTDQYAIASPANELEYLKIFSDSNTVEYELPENGSNTTNYFVGLEK